eukprot:TRINITY_DN25260_c0_g1_i6.p1 TRINITY_DN25260_c0_g1~~TRINITY_DN25260_c0_g1_i6.p1  ORF type:complete len:187 (-),score=19.57 TRINITY_DN25260_c0_g1_i6:53-565(-)
MVLCNTWIGLCPAVAKAVTKNTVANISIYGITDPSIEASCALLCSRQKRFLQGACGQASQISRYCVVASAASAAEVTGPRRCCRKKCSAKSAAAPNRATMGNAVAAREAASPGSAARACQPTNGKVMSTPSRQQELPQHVSSKGQEWRPSLQTDGAESHREGRAEPLVGS